METTRLHLPMEWEEHWRREKEQRKKVIEEGGHTFEEEDRKLRWIVAYNNRRMGLRDNGDTKGQKNEDEIRENGIAEEGIHTYYKHNYPAEIFRALDELRHSSLLTDLTLSTEDGLNFHAHSPVLAAMSSVILQRLQEKDRDHEREISVCLGPQVSASGLAAVLEFAYTGEITSLRRETQSQIQAAALSLGIPRVLQLCKEEEEEDKERKGGGGGTLEKKRKISAPEQMKATLESIGLLWAERVGCDVDLKVEGRLFHAHRVILAANSDYFRGMFTGGMKESQQTSVTLLLLGATELEVLLHCSYNGALAIGWGCVFELTCTAQQFQFQHAYSLCLDFLRQEIDAYNFLDVVFFAEAYGIDDLRELAEDFVLRHFQEVATTPKFLDLPVEKLLDFLYCDGLSVPSELAVFRAAVSWVEADPAERLPQASTLMSGVRFPLMTFREFREVRAINLRMECSVESEVELYGSALKEFGLSCEEQRHRIRHPKDALVLVGGDQLNPDVGQRIPSRQLWFANSFRSGIGMVKEIDWRMLGEMPDHPRFRHGAGVLDGKLYVAGGCHFYAKADTMKSAYRYNPDLNNWTKLADMQEKRSNFTVVVRGDCLYAIGGDKDINTNLDSVEVYSPDTNSWSNACPLDQALSGHAATVWGGEIFISGGFDCRYQCLVSMVLYHPERGITYLSEMTTDRAQHCMESFQGRIYVFGGVSNLRKFYMDQLTCEIYNPVKDSWSTFTPLPIPHVGAASVVLEERLYILGGYCQEDYSESRLIHRYDLDTQRWENMGRMPGPTTDIRACLLHLPSHLRR